MRLKRVAEMTFIAVTSIPVLLGLAFLVGAIYGCMRFAVEYTQIFLISEMLR